MGQAASTSQNDTQVSNIMVFYISVNRTCHGFARRIVTKLESLQQQYTFQVKSVDLTTYDHEDILSQSNTVNLYVLPSYQIESPVDSFLSFLTDAQADFRVSKGSLSTVFFSVLGVGHTEYGEDFCRQPQKVDALLGELGGRRFGKLGMADCASDPEADLDEWLTANCEALMSSEMYLSRAPLHPAYLKDDSDEELSADESDNYSDASEETEETRETSIPSEKDELQLNEQLSSKERAKQKLALATARKAQTGNQSKNDDDIEELGKSMSVMKTMTQEQHAREKQTSEAESQAKMPVGDQQLVSRTAPKEMISPLTRKALTKQGYALVGSHSAVKTCRWTKSAIRGRGYCYKHTFYGIDSARCMEATPSLACANKCSFCWRSHTNPVGTKWRWQMDDPEFVVNNSVNEHVRLVKQLAGMPDVRKERFESAKTPRHAALSLVGEPVMYPEIAKYINLLHERHISTFLVTNAQFPDALRNIPPVTQLYLSIDAATKDTLKKIDRPLHRDFWERFLESIDILRKKNIRTVFRLTLVKDQNDDELDAYAELIRRGKPSFIEVKGVTFCGYGGGSDLTIANSPFHQDVVNFVQNLVSKVEDEYDIASEHAHSCCVLAAKKEFCVDGEWKTWIDYDKFFQLVESGQPFGATDYMDTLPPWAVFGAPEAGFSPEDVRWHRKKKAQRLQEQLEKQ